MNQVEDTIFREQNDWNRLNCIAVRNKISQLNKKLRDDPNSLRLHELLAQYYLFLKNYDKALEVSEYLLQAAPENPIGYLVKGAALISRKEYVEGDLYLQRALVLDGNLFEVYFEMGYSQIKQGKLVEAQESFQKTIALRPTDWRSHLNLGNIIMGQKKYKEGFHEHKLAWRYHKSLFVFLTLIESYDISHIHWTLVLSGYYNLFTLMFPSLINLLLVFLSLGRWLVYSMLLFVHLRVNKRSGKAWISMIVISLYILLMTAFYVWHYLH